MIWAIPNQANSQNSRDLYPIRLRLALALSVTLSTPA